MLYYSEHEPLDKQMLTQQLAKANDDNEVLFSVLLLATANSSYLWFDEEHCPNNVKLCQMLREKAGRSNMRFVICPTTKAAQEGWNHHPPALQSVFGEFLSDSAELHVWNHFNADEELDSECFCSLIAKEAIQPHALTEQQAARSWWWPSILRLPATVVVIAALTEIQRRGQQIEHLQAEAASQKNESVAEIQNLQQQLRAEKNKSEVEILKLEQQLQAREKKNEVEIQKLKAEKDKRDVEILKLNLEILKLNQHKELLAEAASQEQDSDAPVHKLNQQPADHEKGLLHPWVVHLSQPDWLMSAASALAPGIFFSIVQFTLDNAEQVTAAGYVLSGAKLHWLVMAAACKDMWLVRIQEGLDKSLPTVEPTVELVHYSEQEALDKQTLSRKLAKTDHDDEVLFSVLLLATANSSYLWFDEEHCPNNVKLCQMLREKAGLSNMRFVICPTTKAAQEGWNHHPPALQSVFGDFLPDSTVPETWTDFNPEADVESAHICSLCEEVNQPHAWQAGERRRPSTRQPGHRGCFVLGASKPVQEVQKVKEADDADKDVARPSSLLGRCWTTIQTMVRRCQEAFGDSKEVKEKEAETKRQKVKEAEPAAFPQIRDRTEEEETCALDMSLSRGRIMMGSWCILDKKPLKNPKANVWTRMTRMIRPIVRLQDVPLGRKFQSTGPTWKMRLAAACTGRPSSGSFSERLKLPSLVQKKLLAALLASGRSQRMADEAMREPILAQHLGSAEVVINLVMSATEAALDLPQLCK
ncbi:unnamed protein product [Durusdinium trenchii]|uniref:Uncharacterized protein n=1 Tax=Durusdinium trenchii TaxID=1381693 RepID=A0ABP0QR08_9DINO